MTGSTFDDYLSTIGDFVPRLRDDAWTDWHGRTLRKIVDGLGLFEAGFEKLQRQADDLRNALAKFHTTVETDRSAGDMAGKVADLRRVLLEKLAEPAQRPGAAFYGHPIHLIGRAVAGPDTWH